jgi:hypothetical protein
MRGKNLLKNVYTLSPLPSLSFFFFVLRNLMVYQGKNFLKNLHLKNIPSSTQYDSQDQRPECNIEIRFIYIKSFADSYMLRQHSKVNFYDCTCYSDWPVYSNDARWQNVLFYTCCYHYAASEILTNEIILETLGWAVPWLRSLVAGLSPQRPGFAPGSIHVGFVVE